jgi:hypothetical protein
MKKRLLFWLFFSLLSINLYAGELHDSAYSGDFLNVKKLLGRGVETDLRDRLNHTALHWAIIANNLKIAELLLESGAEINAVDGDGWTALHIAVSSNNISMVSMLLYRGANFDIKNKNGDTPLAIASKNNNQKIAQLLRQEEVNRQQIIRQEEVKHQQIKFEREFERLKEEKRQKIGFYLVESLNKKISIIREELKQKNNGKYQKEAKKQLCALHNQARKSNSIFTILNIYSRFEPPLAIDFESTLYLADVYLAWSISADLWLGILNDEWPKPNWPISYCENLDSTFSIQQPDDSKIKIFSVWLKELADRSGKSDYASILKDQMPEQWSSILLEYADLQREAKQRLEMLDKIYNSSKSDPNSDVEAVDALRRYTNTLRLLQQAQDKALRTYLFDAVLLPYIDWREQQIRNDPKNTIEYAAEFSKLTEFTQYAVDPAVQRKAFEITRLIKEKIGEEAYKEAVARAKMTPDWYRTVQELGKP